MKVELNMILARSIKHINRLPIPILLHDLRNLILILEAPLFPLPSTSLTESPAAARDIPNCLAFDRSDIGVTARNDVVVVAGVLYYCSVFGLPY